MRSPSPQQAPAPTPPAEADQAVEFLTALVPHSPAERTRAFAALLRTMTAEATQ